MAPSSLSAAATPLCSGAAGTSLITTSTLCVAKTSSALPVGESDASQLTQSSTFMPS